MSCLYRRPSGIYVVRLVVPARLRSVVGRGEVHVSTGIRDCNAAKLAALKIEYDWRERFMVLDVERLASKSPLLNGDGFVSIVEAGIAIGLSASSLLGELRNDGADIWTQAQHWPCWFVADYLTIDTESEGGFVLNDVEAQGVRQGLSGVVRPFQSGTAIGSLVATGTATVDTFRRFAREVFFVEDEGVYKGRKPSLAPEKVAEVLARAAAGEKVAALSREYGISHEAFYGYKKKVAICSA